ncbi:Transglycosylase associated protein [Opitutaceae bacterium TAV1]|nr:Transglycosylase associated protein [Opitutaceae bacterium TAV1]
MLTFPQIIVILLVGTGSGWLVHVLGKGRRPLLPLYLVAGIAGALVGGPLLRLLGLVAANLLGTGVAALIGALLLLLPLRWLKR